MLLQSVTMQFLRLFRHISYYKCGKVILLQSVTDCYYKVRQVLQSATVITKWDVTHAYTNISGTCVILIICKLFFLVKKIYDSTLLIGVTLCVVE